MYQMETGARQVGAGGRIRDALPEIGKTGNPEEVRKDRQETKRVKKHGI